MGVFNLVEKGGDKHITPDFTEGLLINITYNHRGKATGFYFTSGLNEKILTKGAR
jgi:hypothetical protein